MKTRQQSGNVLFLILIAVALFAALSYTISSSLRSGENAAGDEGNLSAEVLVNQVVYMRTELLKAYYANDGIALSPNTGEFYDPSLRRTVTHPLLDFVKRSVFTEYPTYEERFFTWYVDLTRHYRNSVDIGTNNNDVYLFMNAVDERICREVHAKINGRDALVSTWHVRNSGPLSATPDPVKEYSAVYRDGTPYYFANSFPVDLVGDYEEGCFDNNISPPIYSLHFKVLER